MNEHICYACDSTKTYYDRRGNCYLWYLNHDINNNALCSNCYKKIFWHPKWDKKRITYKGKRIYLKELPRKNKCESCGKEGYTHIHHEKYDDENPMNYTKELCPKCHTVETHKLNQYKIPLKERPRGSHGQFI